MPFATRLNLLNMANVHRLAQLSVPTDKPMPDEAILRVALEGGDLTEFTQHDQDLVDLALSNIDQALVDANALLVSYGIPDNAATTLITRFTCQVAVYLLATAQDSVSESQQSAYNNVIKQLEKHARGETNLVPDANAAPIVGDVIEISSNSSRYTPQSASTDWTDW